MANPPGNHQEPAHASSSAFNGNGSLAPDSSGTASAMKHNPGISMEWTAEEQAILDHGLSDCFSADTSSNLWELEPDARVTWVAETIDWEALIEYFYRDCYKGA
ncbi:hypothetical protein CRG98_015796 [Punica granatum]|uniref:Myb-like domain-containing protein n=1 Tax=Punica granatum TaxID=22663 RepID=A0A2I0K5J2_PUNGR|nr:hypothetical protein CRG98_015796 [Punica granatum]